MGSCSTTDKAAKHKKALDEDLRNAAKGRQHDLTRVQQTQKAQQQPAQTEQAGTPSSRTKSPSKGEAAELITQAAERRFLPYEYREHCGWQLASETAEADSLGVEDELSVLTYNVWFDMHLVPKRWDALFEVMRQSRADVICLQEVMALSLMYGSPEFTFLDQLLAQPWVQASYTVTSDTNLYQILGVKRTATAEQLDAALRKKSDECTNEAELATIQRAHEFLSDAEQRAIRDADTCLNAQKRNGYGVLMMIRKGVRIEQLLYQPLTSTTGRGLLTAKLVLAGGSVSVSTVHLESLPKYAHVREAQLREINQLLKHEASAVLCGDFNFGDGSLEEAFMDERFTDVWKQSHPDESGDTMQSTDRFAAWRPDRMMVTDRGLLSPTTIEIAGNEPMAAECGQCTKWQKSCCPSDHFALLARFRGVGA